MTWQMITTGEEVAKVLSQASGSRAVMVDTEFMRRNTFYPQVALLQLCFDGGPLDGRALLIDPLELDDNAPLVDLLTRSDLVKVLHSASEDLEVFQRWLGELPSPFFDTQRAAGLLDLGFGLGYRALVQLLCDTDLPKGETRSDWLQRPLTESQCDYAAQDVTWLLKVWRQLESSCLEQGKLDWVIDDGDNALRNARANSVQAYHRRIKGAWKLSPRELAVLAGVCEWRELTARGKDKPRSWIIDDKACLQIAQSSPVSLNTLRAAVDLPPPALRRYGDELVRLITEQGELPDSSLPEALPRPLDARQRDLVKKLKSRARDIGEQLGAAPQALLQSGDYELLVREADGGPVEVPRHWQGWRRERVIDPLRSLLAS